MKNLKLFILATITLFLVSCGNLSLNQQNTVKEGYTQLSIGMYRSNSRTLSPASEIDLEDFDWTISFESDLISVKDEEITDGLSTTVTLPNGIYKISAKSKADTADFAGLNFSGSKTVTLDGNTQNISIPVSLTKTTDGTGTIFADTLTFPEIIIQEDQAGTSSGTITMEYCATLVSVKDTLTTFPLDELTVSGTTSQIYTLAPTEIPSGYYYLELYCNVNKSITSSDGSISAGVELLKTIKLDTPDTLVEIADDVATDISGISISENSSNKTYYATVGESKYNGVWASYPANLNTLLKKLTSTTDWYYATIYITDTPENTDESLNITINADCLESYANVDTSKIDLKLQLSDGSDEDVGTIQKSPYSDYLNRGIFTLSGEEIGHYNYEFLPGQYTSDVLINASGYIYRSIILHDGISFICPIESRTYLNLTLDPANDFNPTKYNPALGGKALIYFDYMTEDVEKISSDSSFLYLSNQDDTYTYDTYLNKDKTELYLLPAILDGETITVGDAIPDFSISVGYDSTKTYSTRQPFYIYDDDLYLHANPDNDMSFTTGTTFVWLINNYAIDGDSINLTTATEALYSSSNTLQCIAFCGDSIKSKNFTLAAVEPVNSDILYYKPGEGNIFYYSFESAENTFDSSIDYESLNSVAIYKNNYLFYYYDNALRSTLNPDTPFFSDISVARLNYYALTDSLYFTNTIDSSYNFYRITGISDKSEIPTDDITPYYSLDLSTGINAPKQIRFTDDYVVSVTNNDPAGTNLPTYTYTCNIYENNPEAEEEADRCKVVSTITLDFSSLTTKNLTIKDLIINEKHNAAFVLIKDYYNDYGTGGTNAEIYSHGGLLKIPLDKESSTIYVTADDLIGWDETVTTYTCTDGNEVNHTLTFTGPTDQDSTKFIAPQKFVAIRDDELIIGDHGYYFIQNDNMISSSQKVRVFVYDLNEETLNILEELTDIQNETYEEEEVNYATGWMN